MDVKSGRVKTIEDARLLRALRSRAAQPAPVLDELLGFVDEAKRQEWLRVRGPQARQFVEDWSRLESRIPDYQRRYPTPHFESFSTTTERAGMLMPSDRVSGATRSINPKTMCTRARPMPWACASVHISRRVSFDVSR